MKELGKAGGGLALWNGFAALVAMIWVPRLDVYVAKLYVPQFASAFSIATLLGVALRIATSAGRLRRERDIDFGSMLAVALGAFIVLAGFASGEIDDFAQYAGYLVSALTFVAVTNLSEVDKKAFGKGLTAGLALLAISIVVDILGLYDFGLSEKGERGAGFAENPNFAAAGIVSAAVGLRLIGQEIRLRTVATASVALLATGSRYGLVCALIYGIDFLRIEAGSSYFGARKLWYLLVVVVLVWMSAWLLNKEVSKTSSMARRLSYEGQVEMLGSDDTRIKLISRFVREIIDHPLGSGLSGSDGRELRAHNTILNYARDFGVHCGLLVAALVAVVSSRASKLRVKGLRPLCPLFFVASGVLVYNSTMSMRVVVLVYALAISATAMMRVSRGDLHCSTHLISRGCT